MNQQDQKEASPQGPGESRWERDILNRLAFASLNEQRRSRHWGIFFKTLGFLYLFLLLFLFTSDKFLPRGGEHLDRYTALVDMQGEIVEGAETSADNIIAGLRSAFEDDKTAGVILRVNSPGGSPVQSGIIYDEILRLRKEHKGIPIYAVVGDICASGCYYIVAGADAIYANRASLMGSIGVIMSGGFGFVGTMKKLGVERRLHAAGKNKAFLDPFSPERPSEVAHIKSLLNDIHAQFIKAVREGRGERLKENPKIFSGLIWTGEQAINMGLADDFGTIDSVAREVIGVEDIVDFTPKRPYFEQLFNRFGTSVGAAITKQLSLQLR